MAAVHRARRSIPLSVGWVLSVVLISCTGRSGSDLGSVAPPSRTVAIVGATIIDGTGEPAVDSGVIVIREGRIRAVGPAGDVRVPTGIEVIDATGRFLLPGFIDAHAHVALGPVTIGRSDDGPTMSMAVDPEVARRSLPSLLAHGITTIRDPGGPAEVLVGLRDRVDRGELIGPEMRVAGEVIDQSAFHGLTELARTPEDVRAAVRRQAAAGVDMIKLYTSLTPDLVAAGIDEAHAHGLPAIAHLMATTWTHAAEMGIDGILHILPGSPELLPEDSVGELVESMRRGTQFMVRWFELVDYEAPAMREAIHSVARHDVVLDPTLAFFDALVRADDPAVTEAPDLSLAAPSLTENWQGSFHMNLGWTAEDFERGRAAFAKMLELTRRLHAAGVTLAAGTDANNPWVVPGPSFHRELELLADAGIPNEEVLIIVTANGARAAGLFEDRGTIEVGKRADLVLLAGDPRDDIRATRNVLWVMQEGRLFRPKVLLDDLFEAASTE